MACFDRAQRSAGACDRRESAPDRVARRRRLAAPPPSPTRAQPDPGVGGSCERRADLGEQRRGGDTARRPPGRTASASRWNSSLTMKPFTGGAGCVSGHPMKPTDTPASLRMLQSGRACSDRAVVRLFAQETEPHERLREAVVGQQLERRIAGRARDTGPTRGCRWRPARGRSRRRSTPARPASASAWPGAARRRASKMRPKFGSRPSATAGEMTSSVAPSRARTMTARLRTASRPATGDASGGESTRSRGPPARARRAAPQSRSPSSP